MVTTNFGNVPALVTRNRAFSNIQPFTYEDGTTYHEMLESMRAYIETVLIPFIQEGLDGFGQDVIDELNARLTDVETMIDEAEILVAEAQSLRDDVASIHDSINALYADIQTLASNAEAARDEAQDARTGAEAARDETQVMLRERVATPGDYGAIGDGVSDDTVAWGAFQADTTAVKFVPPGEYFVNGETFSYPAGQLGGGTSATNLSPSQYAKVSTRPEVIPPDDAAIFLSTDDNDADIKPTIYVINRIDDTTGDATATKVAGIHSYMEQTGTSTNQYVKAITGVAANAAAGDNDSTGVVGYSYKLNVPGGVGDAAGAGGAAWQYSQEEGLVLGGEFAAYQNVEGTRSSPNATNGNNTMSLHLTTNSIGDRVWSALGIDGQNAATEGMGRFGYWNAITIARSCFGNDGVSEEGTVGINFGNNTSIYPEKAMYLGNAVYHFWRNNAATRMRTSSLDIDNGSGAIGVRLVTPSGSPKARYVGGYRGATGPDGETSVTNDGFLSFGSNGYVSIVSHDNGSEVSRVELSSNSASFLPSPREDMNLGAGSRRWNQIYAINDTISTSDERAKQDITNITDAALDAWGEVGYQQYRMIDSVNEKGAGARIHSGLIAQRVMNVFSEHGLDASNYGLLCYDEWEHEPERVDVQKVLKKHAVYEQVEVSGPTYAEDGSELSGARYEDGDIITPEEYDEVSTVTPAVEAGNRYGIRYSEALVFEAAYQRRRADRIEERLGRLEELAEI